MTKHDLDSAYQRLHWHATYALICITVVANIAYVITRLCFRIASGPNKCCLVSELMVDFATALMSEKETWDPDKLFNPNENIPLNIQFVKPQSKLRRQRIQYMILMIQTIHTSMDTFDNLLTLILEEIDSIKKGIDAIQLICFIIFCPFYPKKKSIPRTYIISKSNLLAEGMLPERKTFLGWILD